MSQKKVYLYSPDGQAEGWYMEDEAPAGWLTSQPEVEVSEGNPDGMAADPELEDLKQKVAEAEAE